MVVHITIFIFFPKALYLSLMSFHMKKIDLLLSLTGFVYHSFAQTNTFATPTSNVGILSTSPTHSLTLRSTATGIAAYNTADYQSRWISPFENTLGSDNKYLIDVGTNTAANGAGTHTSRFSVDNTGVVTVGRDFIGSNGRIQLIYNTVQGAQTVISDSISTGKILRTMGMSTVSVGSGTVTYTVSTGIIATHGTNTFSIPSLAATNATTLTNISTLYIDGAWATGTNMTITNSSAFYVNVGNSRSI